jgi:two-component system nitrate/nitrite response regulator NarL
VNLVILTPVRLLGESLATCLSGHGGIERVEITFSYPAAMQLVATREYEIVMIDVTQGFSESDVRSLVMSWPRVRILALGLEEQRDAVIRCGRSGFSGYVSRDADLATLRRAVLDCDSGRLTCSAEIAGDLMRALFSLDAPAETSAANGPLTRRQADVVELIGRGLSNKEIAKQLNLSVATVKNHVHNVLEKLHVTRRAHVIRRIRGSGWGNTRVG